MLRDIRSVDDWIVCVKRGMPWTRPRTWITHYFIMQNNGERYQKTKHSQWNMQNEIVESMRQVWKRFGFYSLWFEFIYYEFYHYWIVNQKTWSTSERLVYQAIAPFWKALSQSHIIWGRKSWLKGRTYLPTVHEHEESEIIKANSCSEARPGSK